MIEGGLRLSHALCIIKNFEPNEVVEVIELYTDTPRLICFEDKRFCRYYVVIDRL